MYELGVVYGYYVLKFLDLCWKFSWIVLIYQNKFDLLVNEDNYCNLKRLFFFIKFYWKE